MSKLLSAIWEKIKHPVRTEAAILFAALAVGVSQGLQWLSDHVDDFEWTRGTWRPVVLLAIAALLTRWKVWSEKTVDEIKGEST